MLKVGLIGYGNMGKLHAINILHMKDTQIAAVADPSKRALRKAELVGVHNLYSDYHDLLAHAKTIGIDVVIITIPNSLHYEAIQLSLESKINVFTEKPMATTIKECSAIVDSVKRSGQKLMVGYNLRFLKTIEQMKTALDKGHIGNLEHVTLELIGSGPFSDWWFDSEKTGGGALVDKGSHLIDLFRFFAGDAKVLFSSLDYKFNLPLEDGAIVALGCINSSAKGTIIAGWYQSEVPSTWDFHVHLHGNSGFLISNSYTPGNFYRYAMKETAKNVLRRITGKAIHPLSYLEIRETYYKELSYFFNCIRLDKTPSISSATDGLKATEIIEEAYKISTKNQ